MRLLSTQSIGDKARYELIRTDFYTKVRCDSIISADEDSGECIVKVGEEAKNLSFGPNMIKIVGRRR